MITVYTSRITQRLYLLLIWSMTNLWFVSIYAQELPPITNYPPTVYGADNQNWQASQDDAGIIYFANNKGLLSYNGAQWHLNPSPNETIIRSVKVINDLVYTGAHMDFGYWKKGPNGVLKYTSLNDSLNVEMVEGEQIWKILQYKDKVLLQSLNGIYIYNPEKNSIEYLLVDTKNAIYRLFEIDEELYFQVEGKGLYTIKDGKTELFDDREIFKKSTFTSISRRGENWLGITQKDGIYRITSSIIESWNHEAANTLKDITIYRSRSLSDGSIALGTIAHGFIKLTKDGAIDHQLMQNSGLGNNTVLSIFEDRSKNIWAGLDNGIACINMDAPIHNYFDQKGRLGTIYTSAVHNQALYLGTNQGLFYKANGETDFTFVTGTEEQVWMLQVIDGTLFCGHNRGTFVVDDGVQKQIGAVDGTWNIREIPNRPDLLLQGNYDGLYVLEKVKNEWSVRNKIQGFDVSSRYFEFAGEYNILVSNEYKGVYEVEIDSAFAKVKKQVLNSSVTKGEHSSLVQFADDIFYANKQGIFKYNSTLSEFEVQKTIMDVFENQFVSGKLLDDGQGKLWAFTESELIYFSKDALETDLALVKIKIPQSLRNTVKGFENITPLGNDTFLLGKTNGYLTFKSSFPAKEYEISINQIKRKKRDGSYVLMPLLEEGDFSWKENNAVFSYHVPQFAKFQETQFQHRLKGFYDAWSDWSTLGSHEFTNIPSGAYTFEVRARVGDVIAQQTASYKFNVGKPWYASYMALVAYILLGLLLLVLLNAYNKKRYKVKQDRLLEKTKRELDLKALAIEKENIELRNENLRNDIQARNRDLATSTMAMVSKSKTLSKIKERLSKLNSLDELDGVIKEINKNISTKEDWSFFEKAFNQADKDFFKKVKDKHPELTTNDLKLCVYLRLNMSSKEIAPLLNISYRSVEIKRYRLRKKIGLERDVQLNEYFINL